MKRLLAAAVILCAACASSQDPGSALPPPPAAADPRIGELQTAMTELLERIDVLNDRMARLEESGAAGSQPAVAQPVAAQPAERRRAESPPLHQEPQPVQRALVGARLAEDYRKAIMLFGRGSHGEARQ